VRPNARVNAERKKRKKEKKEKNKGRTGNAEKKERNGPLTQSKPVDQSPISSPIDLDTQFRPKCKPNPYWAPKNPKPN
jgi:hypothetical protein